LGGVRTSTDQDLREGGESNLIRRGGEKEKLHRTIAGKDATDALLNKCHQPKGSKTNEPLGMREVDGEKSARSGAVRLVTSSSLEGKGEVRGPLAQSGADLRKRLTERHLGILSRAHPKSGEGRRG